MTQRNARMAHAARARSTRALEPEIALPLLVSAAVLVCLLVVPLPDNRNEPPGALWVLLAIMLVTATITRRLRMRFGLDARAALALPDPLFTLDLATVVLVGPRPAVLLAMAASLLVTLPDGPADRAAWVAVTRQAAAAGLTTLVAALAYRALSRALEAPISLVHAHLAAALVSSLLLLLGASVLRTLEDGPKALARVLSWRVALANPALRFQALMLAIGPLLPLAEVLDDVEAELAWLLFLVPLYAIYYLALVSIRMEQRTAELQRTVEQLSASRQREAELTGYAALITRAQEEERRRLARELHDDTAQTLIALSRGLDALSTETSRAAPRERDVRFVADLSELAKRSLESIRRACQDLRPSVLDDLGLCAALASLATATTQRGLPCEFRSAGEQLPWPPEVEMTVYRIAQEAVANARQHAAATAAVIELAYLPAAMRLRVRDNGHGFSFPATTGRAPLVAPAPETRSGLGLLGMRERATLIGAQLAIESAPGTGTRVRLLVRLSEAAPERSNHRL